VKRKTLIWSFLLVPLLVYLAICVLAFFAQTWLIFPAGQVGPAGPPPAGAERLEIAAASGERLRGVHIAPARRGGERLLILGFGGNAWNAEAMAALLHDFYPQADVVAFHYRGYPPSEGRPGAAALEEDALHVHDFATARFRPARTVAIGFSIGSGVAAALAARRRLDGAILVTPFDSLGAAAAGHYPWLPVRLLLRHDFRAAEALGGKSVPVAIVAAADDTIMPAARTDALRRALANLVFDRTIAGAGHNDIYHRDAFRAAMTEALAALAGR
jgi:uncharacterized protein